MNQHVTTMQRDTPTAKTKQTNKIPDFNYIDYIYIYIILIVI